MSASLNERLNVIQARITDESFLSSRGIGNEIACYIFDYDAADELRVREHIEVLKKGIATQRPGLRVLHIDLLDVSLAYLEQRGLLDRAVKMQASKGDAAVLRALKGPLSAEKLRDHIATEYEPAEQDLVLLSGVGSVWPMVRAHSLLSSLHTVIGQTPLVMFYPGSFDGTTLRLFGHITSGSEAPGKKPYYRAFILVPRETTP